MKKTSRRWFDLAYDFIRKSGFPIGCLTGPCFYEDVVRIASKKGYTPKEIKRLNKIFKRYYQKLPCREDFLEEKAEVSKTLVPELRMYLDFVDTAITFGEVRGDIDIGLISTTSFSDNDLTSGLRKIDLPARYPLVDWDSLYFFKGNSGNDLVHKMLKSRFICLECITLPPEEYCYVRDTCLTAKLLWGNEAEVTKLHKFFAPSQN